MFLNIKSVSFIILILGGILTLAAPKHLDDLEVVYGNRLRSILGRYHNAEKAYQLQRELTPAGNWTDVDYTAGCPARRANWPAQDHFHNIITMASAYYYNREDSTMLDSVSNALDWWFDRDYKHDDCVNAGGRAGYNCPCGTPGMWNTNWYDQMILIPGLVSQACLVVNAHSALTPTQISNCSIQISRAYDRIDGDPNGSMGPMTGANMLDVSSTGVSLAILSSNFDLLMEALTRMYLECQINENGFDDGIKVDGSFLQHSSQIYNGNYGKVFMNAMIGIFSETSGASADLIPPSSVQDAFLTHLRGNEWFIYKKKNSNQTRSPQLSWQYSVIGRMVSHKYSDWSGIDLNLERIVEATKDWPTSDSIREVVDRLNATDDEVNPGRLLGTRYFHTSDYFVHRGASYIVTLKMFSSRTTNSECNNGQNPFGFHLSDGAIYTYIHGDEYTDVYGAWDWNLIPGTSVDYRGTNLDCGSVQFKGRENFVGGVGQGNFGVAVMNYTNPQNQKLSWMKTYFFFPGAYIVQYVGNPKSSDPSTSVYTTLDQRQHGGNVSINGVWHDGLFNWSGPVVSLWHDRVQYLFPQPVNMTVEVGEKQADWEAIGISKGNETQTLFSAYFEHPRDFNGGDDAFTYMAFLDVPQNFIPMKGQNGHPLISVLTPPSLQVTAAPATVRATEYGQAHDYDNKRVISMAFITGGEYETGLDDINRVDTDAPVMLIFERFGSNGDSGGWRVAVADPTQALREVEIKVYQRNSGEPTVFRPVFPTGPWAGSSVTVELMVGSPGVTFVDHN